MTRVRLGVVADGGQPVSGLGCWPPKADTSVAGDGGFTGCKAEPACVGAGCRSICPSGSSYRLTCRDPVNRVPDPSLNCIELPISLAGADGAYCCPCPGTKLVLPTCHWPSSLDGDASSRATCHAARALVSCGYPGGAGQICASDDPTSCSGGNLVGGPCTDECRYGEYAAWCGGVGPGPTPDPPAGCRSAATVPAGIAYYCCPCG